MSNKSRNHRVSLPFQLLKTFTEKEFINFKKLLSSGYLSANESLYQLLSILKKQALHLTSFTPTLQLDVYKALCTQENTGEELKAPQSKKLNRLMNELLHVAEKFLMFEDLKNTDTYDATMLYPKLVDRNQLTLYNKRIKVAEQKLSKETKRGIEYHNQCYYIEKEKVRLIYINNTFAKEDNYDDMQVHLDLNYLFQKLQYHLAKITLQRRYAHKIFNHKPFASLQTLLSLSKYQSNPLIQLYLLNIQLIEKEEGATFLALLRLLREKQKIIPTECLNTFYVNLTNYCTRQLAKGCLNYYKYLFEIYKDMDKGNLLVIDKSIEFGLLKNLVTTACQVNAFDWAVEKLSTYIKYVPNTIRKSVFEYNTGIIAFNQLKYKEALAHFMQVKKIDDTHELSLRIAQLQCFYETDLVFEKETLQLIESLKAYIHQNKRLAPHHKTSYINFTIIFKKLYKYKDIPDKRSRLFKIEKTLPDVKALLKQYDLIWRKPWLLSKIKDLEK